MKNKTCFLIGHEKIPDIQYMDIVLRLEDELTKLAESGVTHFAVGNAAGFDTLAALTVLELQEKYPQVRLTLVLPFKERTDTREEYGVYADDYILEEVVYTSESHHPDCMMKRNRYLADTNDICVCYLTKSRGGTACTVDYARKKGLEIINLSGSMSC